MRKILIISSIQTPPIQAGNQKCIYEYSEMLKQMGFDVYFLYIKGRQKINQQLTQYWGNKLFVFERKWIPDIIKRGFIEIRKKITNYNHVDDFYPIGLTSFVKKIQKEYHFDNIIINYITLSKLFKANLSCKKILYAHDCLSFKKKRLNIKKFWIDLTPNQEALGLQRCPNILSIQENETIFFKYLHPTGNILSVYSNFQIHKPIITGNKNILFLSGKSILNINGIKYFIHDIFPLILEKEPHTQLIIGGSICDVLKEFDTPNIKMIGRIDDENNFYALGDICINPIYQGTGLKIKTFEALSYGKTTIVHPHSAEGIFLPKDAPILIGNTPQEFALHIIKALSNIEMRYSYSNKAISYIQTLNEYIKQQYLKILE